MKLKKILRIIIFLCCIGLSACSSNNESNNNSQNSNSSVADGIVISNIDELQSISEFAGELDFDYVYETDCQSYVGSYPITAYTENGYYTINYTDDSGTMYLMFYDYVAEQEVYVCSKSNCEHNDDSCDAYLDENTFTYSGLWYYDGNLYTPMKEEDYLCMCKISLDGTTRENVCTIQRINIETEIDVEGEEIETTYIPDMQIHRGYIYYSSSSGALYRIKLDNGKETETICSIEGTDAHIYHIRPYGQYVFFQIGFYEDSEYGTEAALYVFDTDEAAGIEKVNDGCMREYVISDNKLYFNDINEDVYRHDFETGEEVLLLDLDTENKYSFTFSSCFFIKGNYLVYELSDIETDDTYQLLINENGEVERTLEPDDEKLQPYY